MIYLPFIENLLNLLITVSIFVIFSSNNFIFYFLFQLKWIPEFRNWKGIFIRRSFENVHRYWFHTCRYAELRIMLWYDRRCYWYFVDLWVRRDSPNQENDCKFVFSSFNSVFPGSKMTMLVQLMTITVLASSNLTMAQFCFSGKLGIILQSFAF